MSDQLVITSADIQDLAATLEGIRLSDKERAVLNGIFALAGLATRELGQDVEGFMPIAVEQPVGLEFSTLPGYLNTNLTKGSLVGSFSWGLHTGFADGSVKPSQLHGAA